MATKQTNMRLSEETTAELEALAQFHGIKSRSAIVAMAVRRMARADLGAVATPAVKLPKSKRKPGRPKE